MHRFSISWNPTKRIEHPKLPWGMLSHVHASMQWYMSIVLICFVDATDIAPVLMDGCKKCCGNQSAARTLDGTDSHNGTRKWPTPKCWEIMSAHLLTRVSLSCLFGGCRLSHPTPSFSRAGALSKFQNKRMRLKQPDDETGCPSDFKPTFSRKM